MSESDQQDRRQVTRGPGPCRSPAIRRGPRRYCALLAGRSPRCVTPRWVRFLHAPDQLDFVGLVILEVRCRERWRCSETSLGPCVIVARPAGRLCEAAQTPTLLPRNGRLGGSGWFRRPRACCPLLSVGRCCWLWPEIWDRRPTGADGGGPAPSLLQPDALSTRHASHEQQPAHHRGPSRHRRQGDARVTRGPPRRGPADIVACSPSLSRTAYRGTNASLPGSTGLPA